MNLPKRRIRLLIVDDSPQVRRILAEGLGADPAIEVVATAPDPYAARDMIVKYRPDVMTLDVEMPRMDGVEFLRRLMPQYPLPVVMVSSLTRQGKRITIEALAAGAVDFVAKPTDNLAQGLEAMMLELRTKVKIASVANVSHYKGRWQAARAAGADRASAIGEAADKIIAIGASTGGTEAIAGIVAKLPVNLPGIVIVQHMPAGFTGLFAERLNAINAISAKEAASGDRILPGHILVAPGGRHLRVVRSGAVYKVSCEEGDKVCGHCPSVEVMMQSVAEQAGRNAVGVMLTGMGSDGAAGMVAMRRAGARTLAQDEASCVVFGMPGEAFQRGGAERLVPLERIPAEIVRLVRQIGKG
ncbi:MAG: chemotaxis response regulator protein-glutamate methylesterase [Thermodesulfobacteriota bacterium]